MAWIASIFGAVTGAVAEKRAGEANERAAEVNASLARRDAGLARDQAKADVALLEREKIKNIGAARAQYGAAGVSVDGSPLDILEQSAYNAELDKQTIIYKGEVEATGFLDSAELERMRGANARREGNLRAASTVLMGGATAVNRMPSGSTGYRVPSTRGGVGSSFEMGDYNYDSGSYA